MIPPVQHNKQHVSDQKQVRCEEEKMYCITVDLQVTPSRVEGQISINIKANIPGTV